MLTVSTFTINERADLAEFLNFYLNQSKNSPDKVKWQLSDQNSFIKNINYKIHTVKKAHKIVGGVISFINPIIKMDNRVIGQFGFLALIDDSAVFKKLMESVELFFKQNSISYYLGPINFSTWDSYRIKTDQFEEKPYLFEPINPRYYNDYFIQEKFIAAKSYITRELTHLKETNLKLEKKFLKMDEHKITIEKFDLNNFEQEMRTLHSFVKKNFQSNFLYTDIEFDEFYKIYASIRNLINPNLFLIAKNSKNELIGFVFGMLDLLNPNSPCALLKTLAVDEKYRELGVGGALMFKIHQEVQKLNITKIKHCLMAEDNVSTNFSDNGDTIFTYKLFGRKI